VNTKLLNQVAVAILDEPREFNMSSWVRPDDESPCGTTACIAGHAVALSRNLPSLRRLTKFHVCPRAEEALGINVPQSDRLFLLRRWPVEFSLAYREASSCMEVDHELRAEIAFWRIQHFIATEGAE
jgi:hypothetical protein